MPPKLAKEDKTFGLKNKNKSKKVQQFVNQVKQQGIATQTTAQREKVLREEKKKRDDAEKKEIAKQIQSTIIQPKVPFGSDPKQYLCAFFKANQCLKGDKCKYSHDLNVGRKAVKKDLYADDRAEDTMDKWDQNKLESAIKERETQGNLNRTTDIVCKFFLEAVENEKYGWFWECANGKECMYRHALPAGFVLKKRETEEERKEREKNEKNNEITIEVLIERERAALGPDTTPVTAETFLKWKTTRLERREAQRSVIANAKLDAISKVKSGMKTGGVVFSGRDMFEFLPEMWQDDENASDDDGRGDDEMDEDEEEDIEISEQIMGSVESLHV